MSPLWRGIDSEYKRRYSLSIWRQFEDHIRSASYTESLSKFYDYFSRKTAIALQSRDAALANSVIGSGEDRSILKALREETATLALMVRIANDERREAWKKEHEERKADENLCL